MINKKIALSVISICLVLMLAQCRKTEVKPVHNDVADVELIEFSLIASSGEKSTIDGTMVNWSEGDKIYVVDMDATGSGLLGYLSAESGGTVSSTFSGSIIAPTAGHRCLFYHTGLNTFTVNNSGEYTYSVANQNGVLSGDSDLDIANRFQLLKSTEPVTMTADMIKNHNFGNNSVSFKGMMAIAHLDFKVDGASFSGTVTVTGGYATATLNAKTGALSPVAGTITLNNVGSDYYMAVIPGTGAQTLIFESSTNRRDCLRDVPVAANGFYNCQTAKVIDMNIPVGALSGEFSLSATAKGYFSMGNLQYLGQAAEGQKWRFAEHQYDYMGNGPTGTANGGNVNLGSQYTDHYNTGSQTEGPNETDIDKMAARDLFGWGCTGYWDTRSVTSGSPATPTYQNNYQPYSTARRNESGGNTTNFYGYGPDCIGSSPYYNLSVECKSDWGMHSIINGGNAENSGWRTPTGGPNGEWMWILGPHSTTPAPGVNCRTSSTINGTANARFAKVNVNGANGLILFPDYFRWDVTTMGTAPSNINVYGSTTFSPSYNEAQWQKIQEAGAVFLPAGGFRSYSTYYCIGTDCDYWSSTSINHRNAYRVIYSAAEGYSYYEGGRHFGFAVRLIYQPPVYSGAGAGDIGDGGNW